MPYGTELGTPRLGHSRQPAGPGAMLVTMAPSLFGYYLNEVCHLLVVVVYGDMVVR